jgi:glycosyltransferase involved in cell wall biosynthesis
MYNHERFVHRCITSLLAQSHREWEAVIVDDGSTDGSAAVVQSFRDSRISYVFQENRGVGALATTINVGVAMTSGGLITMMPSDDTWPDYRLSQQLPCFIDPSVVLTFGRGLRIDENDRVIGETVPARAAAQSPNRPVGSALRWMLAENYIFQPSVLIRRAALDAIGGYIQPDGLYAEDYPTHLALALQGEFRYLDLPLGNYRMHGGQMTRRHLLRMVETDTAYVLDFFRGLSPEMKERTGWSEDALRRSLLHRMYRVYAAVGRRALSEADWLGARDLFGRALTRGDVYTKAKSLMGLVCASLHVDMEAIGRLLGRPLNV